MLIYNWLHILIAFWERVTPAWFVARCGSSLCWSGSSRLSHKAAELIVVNWAVKQVSAAITEALLLVHVAASQPAKCFSYFLMFARVRSAHSLKPENKNQPEAAACSVHLKFTPEHWWKIQKGDGKQRSPAFGETGFLLFEKGSRSIRNYWKVFTDLYFTWFSTCVWVTDSESLISRTFMPRMTVWTLVLLRPSDWDQFDQLKYKS